MQDQRNAFLSSTRPLPNGQHEMSVPVSDVWRVAEEMGLHEADYGSWWFVYESKHDYLESLD